MATIHKAGKKIIAISIILLLITNIIIITFSKIIMMTLIILLISLLILIFVLRFFRYPVRVVATDDNILVAPADGRVVVVEETTDNEILNDKCIQVSIFMSVWNVHINWIPITGVVKYFKYHAGKFLIARQPKSSTLNERTTILIETTNNKKVILRQIAGFVARRIETYTTVTDSKVKKGQEMGFIKFGSRVDILLPVGTEVMVKPGTITRGCITPIAKL